MGRVARCVHALVRQLPELLLRQHVHAGDHACAIPPDVQIAAAGGFFVHVNAAVVVIDHGDGLAGVIPQTALAADPGGGVVRVRLQRYAGLDGGAAAACKRGILLGERAGCLRRCAGRTALG